MTPWVVPSHTLNQTNPAFPKLLLPGFDHGDMKKNQYRKISLEKSSHCCGKPDDVVDEPLGEVVSGVRKVERRLGKY